MKQFQEFPGLGIEHICQPLDNATALLRAQQLSHFMIGVQNFYIRDLGLTRIDPDPPPGDPEDIPWRIELLHKSGPVQHSGIEFIMAFDVAPDGSISDRIDSLVGFLVVDKPKPTGLCTDSQHTPTRIYEWDVHQYERGSGLGRLLLQQADIHPQDEVILDVAETNALACSIYRNYGFTFDTSVPPKNFGIFDVLHRRMHAPGSQLLNHLHEGGRQFTRVPAA